MADTYIDLPCLCYGVNENTEAAEASDRLQRELPAVRVVSLSTRKFKRPGTTELRWHVELAPGKDENVHDMNTAVRRLRGTRVELLMERNLLVAVRCHMPGHPPCDCEPPTNY